MQNLLPRQPPHLSQRSRSARALSDSLSGLIMPPGTDASKPLLTHSPSTSQHQLVTLDTSPGSKALLDTSGEMAQVHEVVRLVRQASVAREECRTAMDNITADFERDFDRSDFDPSDLGRDFGRSVVNGTLGVVSGICCGHDLLF